MRQKKLNCMNQTQTHNPWPMNEFNLHAKRGPLHTYPCFRYKLPSPYGSIWVSNFPYKARSTSLLPLFSAKHFPFSVPHEFSDFPLHTPFVYTESVLIHVSVSNCVRLILYPFAIIMRRFFIASNYAYVWFIQLAVFNLFCVQLEPHYKKVIGFLWY